MNPLNVPSWEELFPNTLEDNLSEIARLLGMVA